MQTARHQENISSKGFTLIDDVFNAHEIAAILAVINNTDQSNPTFRKTEDLFAIRQFFKEIPEVKALVFNEKLQSIVKDLFGDGYFISKSIYFDKPKKSKWFVAWHQDLTISVDNKVALPDYGPWTLKPNQFAVQPPVDILKDNFTLRIHLDDTDEGNGALKVIPSSHSDILRTGEMDFSVQQQSVCSVSAGGMMIMRPLLMHASNRTTSNKQRRVIHIEFSRAALPEDIKWAEKESI